jgi:hypothetical protein
VGLFILLVLYLANLYAGYEIAVVRRWPVPMVMGLSAVLPVVGPIVFLALPAPAGTEDETAPVVENQADAAWQQEEERVEPQSFSRNTFTFDKRFIEDTFAGFIGEPTGEATNFTMELKTGWDKFAVERITRVTATTVVFEAGKRGEVAMPFADIEEIKLKPRST